MKKLLILLMILIPTVASAWIYKTPAGIIITANQRTITQYEKHWGLDWDNIDWSIADDIFYAMKDYYGDEVKKVTTKGLRIGIGLFSDCATCAPGWETNTQWGCLDGGYAWMYKTIIIHLGDDPGQGEHPFSKTALVHEFSHFFLFAINSPCKWDNPVCGEYYPSAEILGIYE